MQYRNSLAQRAQSPAPRNVTPGKTQFAQNGLSSNQLSRIIGVQVKQGQKIKGQSRITYLPYQKKVTEYEERQYIERVPIKRKIVQYEERKQVVSTDYYAVQNITQYYREVVPQKKIQMVPIERKIKKIQYIPVERQVIHYPEGQNIEQAKGKSRVILQQQGLTVRPDAQYKPIDPKLIYNYSSQHKYSPIGYVEDGYQRNLSTAPSIPNSMSPTFTSFLGQPEQQTYLSPRIQRQQYYQSPQQQRQYVSQPSQIEGGYYTGPQQFTTAVNNGPSFANSQVYTNSQYLNNNQYISQYSEKSIPNTNTQSFNPSIYNNHPYLRSNPSEYQTYQQINVYPN